MPERVEDQVDERSHLQPPHAPPNLEVGAQRVEHEREHHVHGQNLAERRLVAAAGWTQAAIAAFGAPARAAADPAMVRATAAALNGLRCGLTWCGDQSDEREHQSGEHDADHGHLLGAERPILQATRQASFRQRTRRKPAQELENGRTSLAATTILSARPLPFSPPYPGHRDQNRSRD